MGNPPEKEPEKYLLSPAPPPFTLPPGLGGAMSQLSEIQTASCIGPSGTLSVWELVVRVDLLLEASHETFTRRRGVLSGVTLCGERQAADPAPQAGQTVGRVSATQGFEPECLSFAGAPVPLEGF